MEKHITCTLTVDIKHDTIAHAMDKIRAMLQDVKPDPVRYSGTDVILELGARGSPAISGPQPGGTPSPDLATRFFGPQGWCSRPGTQGEGRDVLS